MAQGPENKFRDKVIRRELDRLPSCFYFIKEALALRGLPDLVGVINGHFFALEVKATQKEAEKRMGRVVLQRLMLRKIRIAGGFAEFVYPGNWPEILEKLKALASKA